MATRKTYLVGNTPPLVTWTVVRGDTASFRVYATDDAKLPFVIEAWAGAMAINSPPTAQEIPFMTDDATLIVELFPETLQNDGDGEFTVTLAAGESVLLETGDIFDIELSDATRVWTVCQGSMIIIEDVTNSGES